VNFNDIQLFLGRDLSSGGFGNQNDMGKSEEQLIAPPLKLLRLWKARPR
jgi:hypothetical protein